VKKLLIIALGCTKSEHHSETINDSNPQIKKNERYYQELWCNQHNGIMEYVLPDRSRIDCLTDTHAIEFDFAKKWQEAIGQSLYYSAQTEKKAGVVLIIKKTNENKYIQRFEKTIKTFNLPVDYWIIEP